MGTLDLNTTPYIEGDFSSYEEALRVANLISRQCQIFCVFELLVGVVARFLSAITQNL